MISPSYDDFIWDSEPPKKPFRPSRSSAIIENQDGSTMVDAEFVPIENEEVTVSEKKTYIQELSHAIKITWPLIVLIIGSSFAFFSFTQNRIDTQMAEVRAQLADDRRSASADNVALRTDVNQGFTKVADKLDEIGKTLTAIQVDQATQKARTEKSN